MPLTPIANRDSLTMKIAFLLSFILLTQLLSGCSPLIIAGTVAGAGVTVAADRRSPDKIIEDQAIEIQATDFIYSHKRYGKEVHISVTSFNSTVLLTGETLDKASKNEIIKKVTRMRGVNKVIDGIKVKKLASAADRTHDTWITSKVKSHIIAQKGLLTRSKVVTSNSNVYLMGIVNNEEAKQLIRIVKGVNGVNTVTPLFTARDESLDKNLTADAHIKPIDTEASQKISAAKAAEQAADDEDTFTVQHYTIQPAIKMNDDE